ncbi:mesoderm induction early response protein 2 [Chanos chanos]|uniref:Mesoderm induction early response protein 2 n=1 Tax=Chanos chanos TaxID=29144 RepID=A0A6J2W791_CHACN|nr:mesoderm induction early response protein 2-like [Chanos chanos]
MGSAYNSLALSLSDAAQREAFPPATTSLEEAEQRPGVPQVRPVKMATRSITGGEMPLEELLALYGYDVPGPVKRRGQEPDRLSACLPDTTLDKDQMTKGQFSGGEDEETRSSADDLASSLASHASDLLRCHLRGGDKDASVSSSDEDSESTSIPSNDGHKDIMVGSQYQADIPPLCSFSCHERAYEREDQLLWTPSVLSGQAVEEFLLHAQRRGGQEEVTDTVISGDIVKDNEQALYELVKCNFNAEEALRRLRFNVKVFSEELCAWSEEECRNFEHGYRVHGKNFHLIQANKVRTRSVGECVEYYYIWKKSERYEFFTQQATKLGRKKYSLQSGNLEDMDQDGDVGETEGAGNSHGSMHRSAVHLNPPSPTPTVDLDKQEEGLRYSDQFQGRPRRKRTPRYLLRP